MAAKKLAVTTIVRAQPGSLESHVILEAGDDAPEWALDQLGDHVFAKPDGVVAPPEPPTGLDDNGVVIDPGAVVKKPTARGKTA